jgi:hypothetical protein
MAARRQGKQPKREISRSQSRRVARLETKYTPIVEPTNMPELRPHGGHLSRNLTGQEA